MSDTAFCCTRSARGVLSKQSRVNAIITSLGAWAARDVLILFPIFDRSKPVTSETILEVGAEGGSLTLRRERIAGGGWKFYSAANRK